MSLQEDIPRTTNVRFRDNDLSEELRGGAGCVTTIVEARRLLRGGGGESNNVPSNENFVRNSSSNRFYRNKLADTPIDVAAVSARASVASGFTSPTTRMVDRARIRASRMLVSKEDQPMTPRTKKRLCRVRVDLAEKKETLVSLIRDTQPQHSQEAVDNCMVHHELME